MVLILLGGAALVGAASTADDAPIGWWVFGGLGVLAGGWFVVSWAAFRLRYRTPQEREEAKARLIASAPVEYQRLERGKLAHQATKHKAAVLRSGVDGTAIVTFLADGHRGNEFEHLVYLELDVTVGGGSQYSVKTGEYLTAASAGSVAPGRELVVKVDPADRRRVAVDWERSLRLTR
jgi:hypothetical protein